MQDACRCTVSPCEARTASWQEAEATQQSSGTLSSLPPSATAFKGDTGTPRAAHEIIYPLLLISPWTITLLLLLCAVITFLYTPGNTNIIFVRNPFQFYSGKWYEHKTLLGATSYDVKSNSAWNFPMITIGSFLSIEALLLLSVHFIFQLH